MSMKSLSLIFYSLFLRFVFYRAIKVSVRFCQNERSGGRRKKLLFGALYTEHTQKKGKEMRQIVVKSSVPQIFVFVTRIINQWMTMQSKSSIHRRKKEGSWNFHCIFAEVKHNSIIFQFSAQSNTVLLHLHSTPRHTFRILAIQSRYKQLVYLKQINCLY